MLLSTFTLRRPRDLARWHLLPDLLEPLLGAPLVPPGGTPVARVPGGVPETTHKEQT